MVYPMTFLFLADTGASMNQIASNGMTLLDCVKASIEYFIKTRGNVRGDSFYLVDCEEGLDGIKSWKENTPTFLGELKNLKAVHISNLGPALKTSFDLLNLFRIQQQQPPLETYGIGRYPWLTDPAMVILFSNGTLNSPDGITKNLALPMQPHQPGSELTKEPFRWDQKLISIALSFPGYTTIATTKQYTTIAGSANPAEQVPIHPVADSDNPTALMCRVTGGNCFEARTMKSLLQCVDQIHASLTPYAFPGIVVNLEKFSHRSAPEDPQFLKMPQNASHITLHCLTKAGYWPIPEGFVIDQNQPKLLSRSAQPHICYRPIAFEGVIYKGFPFDKYLIDRCELTDWILKTKQTACWSTFIPNSSPTGKNEPFGFIQASSNGVFLYVLPFNFPRLWALLDDLQNKIPCAKWKHEFEVYLGGIPFYYAQPLKKALKRFGIAGNAIPDHLDGSLPFPIVSKLKNLKQQSKKESDRWRAAIGDSPVAVSSVKKSIATTTKEELAKAKEKKEAESDKNVFDINRNDLLDRIQRMRTHVFSTDNNCNKEKKHNVPISRMGIFQEVMSKRKILRDVHQTEEARKRPIFGNPYARNDKNPVRLSTNTIVDEEEEEGENVPQVQNKKVSSKPNPLIAGLFPDADVAMGEEDEEATKLNKAKILQSSDDEDVQLLVHANTSPMDKFLARKRIRDDNVATRVEITKLFRGRGAKNEEEVILRKIMKLRGNYKTKKRVLEFLCEKAKHYKKKKLSFVIEKYLFDLELSVGNNKIY